MGNTKNSANNRIFNRKKTPPNWLNEEERAHWIAAPEWRTTFENEKKHLMKLLVVRFGLKNVIVVVVSLLLAFIIWKINFYMLLGSSTLISTANTTSATAAAVTAIILAFVMFRFGHAKRLEEESRSNIPFEIHHLEEIRVQISDWAHSKVRETADEYKEKSQNLVDAANKLDKTLHELIRRFALSDKRGAYCDRDFLRLLNDHILIRAGDWFVAYLTFMECLPSQFNHREFARKILNDASSAAKNLYRLNENIIDSENEHKQALDLSISSLSLLLVVFIGLLSIFVADSIAPFWVTWITITLVALLACHLIALVCGIIRFMLRETRIRTANRQAYLQEAEKHTQVNKDDMLKDSLKLLKAHPDLTEIIQKVEDLHNSNTR